MRQLVIGLFVMGFVMSAAPAAQASVIGDILNKGKSAVTWTWNLIPGTLNLLNDGAHWLCGKGHEGIHNTAEYFTIDVGE